MRFASKVDGWIIPVIVLLFSIFARTHYTIAHHALSLDRLKVFYGKKKFVLISPADKAGFLSAVERSTRRNEI